jgi:putative transposase
MARAKRHYIPGQIWHITHQCHKREFLLKFAKDRRRWLQWLFEARRRYSLSILNYTITSNHIHLLIADDKGHDVIADSIKLIAGRTGQEFNQRKSRKGAYWEDRYHATAIEDGDHLIKGLVYIDLNMVRAGVVRHPSEWPYSGYNEIQKPKRKKILINYERLREFLGFDTYEHVKTAHRKWVDSCLANGDNVRDSKWTESIAVGSESFIKKVKVLMGGMAMGRKTLESGDSFQLREEQYPYIAHLGAKKCDIGLKNTFVCDLKYENAGS